MKKQVKKSTLEVVTPPQSSDLLDTPRRGELANSKSSPKAELDPLILDSINIIGSFLEDVIRTGFIRGAKQDQLANSIAEFVKRIAAAPAPELIIRTDALYSPAHSCNLAEDYTPLLESMAEMYFLVQQCQRYPSLSPEWQGEVRRLLGIQTENEALSSAGIEDDWLVLSKTSKILYYHDQRRFTYALYGLTSQRLALVQTLQNLHATTTTAANSMVHYTVGQIYQGSLHYYPGVGQIRLALLPDPKLKDLPAISNQSSTSKSRQARKTTAASVKRANAGRTSLSFVEKMLQVNAFPDFTAMLQAKEQYFAINPLALDYPAFVANLRFATQAVDPTREQWFLVDALGQALPCNFDRYYGCARQLKLVNIALGRSFTGFLMLKSSFDAFVTPLLLEGLILDGQYFHTLTT